MRANPEPGDFVALHDPDASIVSRYPGREYRLCGVDSLEVQTGMVRISSKQMISLSRLFLYLGRQFVIALPELVRGTRFHRRSKSMGWVFPRLRASRASLANRPR